MEIILLLIALAVLLAGFEVIVPGGILGVGSALAIIVASVLAYQDYGIYYAIAVSAVSIVVIIAIVFVELRLLSKSKYGKNFFLSSASSGRTLDENEKKNLDGKPGVAMTILSPTGVVEIDGKQHEAFSQDGLLARGDHVEVVRIDNFRVVVKKVD